MLSLLNGKVYFDHANPKSDKSTDAREELAHLDYSPLPRVTGRSLGMGVLVSMGGFIFGYDTGQISGFLEMPDFQQRFGERQPDDTYSFSTIRSGLIVGLLSVGTLVGALTAAPVADAVGRRPSISLWSGVVAAGFVIQVAASASWQQFMAGRLVAGFGVGALSLLVPMFQAETAPPWVRGALVCTYQLFITLGIFVAACLNYGTHARWAGSSASWRVVVGVGWLWTLVLGAGVWLLDETPRWAHRRGRAAAARRTLAAAYGAPEGHYAVFAQMEELEGKLRAEKAAAAPGRGPVAEVVDMFRAPRMAYRILLGVMLQAFQQLTGANYFFYYGTTIFHSVQISSFITQIILNGINFGVTFIGLYLVEHYGRRRSLIAGSVWMFVCFVAFATVGHFVLDADAPASTPRAGLALIVLASLFILGYATTWGPMVWTLVAELYPGRHRARGMALATASNWAWNFAIAVGTPFVTADVDFALGYVFAGCNLAGGLLVWLFVVEGRGRTLEEIDTMYLARVPPRASERWAPPPAEEMARIREAAGTADGEGAPGASSGGPSGRGRYGLGEKGEGVGEGEGEGEGGVGLGRAQAPHDGPDAKGRTQHEEVV